ncbi:sulfopyruvate decarboxylase subunit alpha [Candidatus Alkanophaga liquidiphilum]|nr:MAG: sulfopyruvate decarboxylase subunit alpha [Candidatus Alkanophagales archaeon]
MNEEEEVLRAMKRCGVGVVLTLPCEKMRQLFELVAMDGAFCHIPLSREENGVGIAAGVFLGGLNPLMLIQSTGLGNMINALMSLSVTYKLPLPIIASWRGVYAERIPAQVPLGRTLPRVLEALGIPHTEINNVEALSLIEGAIKNAFEEETPHIILISPKVWESADTAAETAAATRSTSELRRFLQERRENGGRRRAKPELTRFDAIKIISEYLKNEAVISNIGVPSKELFAARDRPLNFYMLGSLGQATPIGLGLATAFKLRNVRQSVFVLEGDGALLMSGALPTVAFSARHKLVSKLVIFCLDNGTWGSTGDQPTYAQFLDMELLARASGIENTTKVHTEAELRGALENLDGKLSDVSFLHVLVTPGNARVPNIPLSPVEIKRRFVNALQ